MNRLFMLEKKISKSKFAESAVKLFDFLLMSYVIILFASLPFFFLFCPLFLLFSFFFFRFFQ